jgi:drug/metabolite transporter (DMT)-like permease
LLYLLGSIILTSYLTLSFKVLERFRISNFQAIVFNYLTCVITGSLVNGAFPITPAIMDEPWLPWAGLMGFSFIFLFNIIAFTAQKLGVAIASVANKLSMVIPFLFSIYLYDEKATPLKIAGIVIALLAVLLTTWPKSGRADGNRSVRQSWMYIIPLVLFLGSGLLDTMVKYVEQGFLKEDNKNAYLITAFAVAAVIGLMFLAIQLISGKEKFDKKAVLAGICIGIPNYFSIWCLVRVLKDFGNRSSAIIPINNMGIVLFSAAVAWLLFREKLTVVNQVGIGLALVAIAMIAYG